MLRLRQERKKRKLTQTQLAAMAGISPQAVSAIELGRFRPYPVWKERIATALGMTMLEVEELFLPEDTP